jgi:hypothetical protein
LKDEDIRFEAHYGLKSDITPGPKSARSRRLASGNVSGQSLRDYVSLERQHVVLLCVQPFPEIELR